MATAPPPNLYDPDFAVASVQPIADPACPVLREVIRYGAAVFARCLAEASQRGEGEPLDEHIAVFFHFRHLLEMLDASNELIRLGRITAARLPLRSAFEALLAIQYILQADTERRAFAFLVGQLKRRLVECDLQTPGTPARLELEKAAAGEAAAMGGTVHVLPADPTARARRAALEGVFTKAKWDEAAAAWEAAKKAQNGRPSWYSLYDGPRNLRLLAERVHKPYSYELLYRSMSDTTHVADLPRVFSAGGGRVEFGCIPDHRKPESALSLALYFGVTASRQILLHYRPFEREDFARWYTENVKTAFHAINAVGLEP